MDVKGQRLTRAEQREQTRAALRAAAAEVFVQRGLQGASVEAITERAGYSRGAFYSNYSSKEELLADVLQDRVYTLYRRMAEHQLATEPADLPTARESAQGLAAIQADPQGAWMFRLWLELLAHAEREPSFRAVAAEFWRGNRALLAELAQRVARARGIDPGLAPEQMAIAMIALDIGIAIQHHVDPEAVPLDVYPDIFGALLDRT